MDELNWDHEDDEKALRDELFNDSLLDDDLFDEDHFEEELLAEPADPEAFYKSLKIALAIQEEVAAELASAGQLGIG